MTDANRDDPVVVDRALEDLVPMFMRRRDDDVEALRAGVAAGDCEALRIIGHSLKGTAGGYGFHWLSALGARIESAARAGDAALIGELAEQMAAHLRAVEIRYVE